MIGALFSFFLPPEKYDPWFKTLLRFFFKIIRVKVVVENAPQLEQHKAYLFMSNHVSLFDVPLLGGYIPIFFRGIAAEYQFRLPLYGWFQKRYGTISIKRESLKGSLESLKEAEQFLKSGKSTATLPEGGRNLDGNLQAFKRLPFHLAKKAGVEIIPIGLSGLFELNRKGSWLLKPQPVKISFSKKISTDELSVDELRDLVRERIIKLIDKDF